MRAALAPLHHPAFRYLALGRAITMFGNAMAPIALAFAVLDLTGSLTDVGLVVAARSLTNVVFLLFGGVVADRLPRQLVMVVSSLLAAASQGTIALLVLTHDATIPRLMALGAVNGLTAAFAFPAASALLAQTVPDTIRKEANAISRLGINAAMIGGASVGGLLVAAFGPGWGLAVDAATFLVAAGSFALVRVATYRDPAAPRTSPLHELREGWIEFRSRTWLWVVVVGFMFFNMAMSSVIGVLGPAVADDTFGRSGWGFLLAAQTAGMVVGAFVALRLKVHRLLLVGVVACFGPIVLVAALSVPLHVAILLPIGFLAGVAIEQFAIAWEVSVQEHVPADKLARVYSYDALGSLLAIPAGQVAAGPLAHALGAQAALLIAAGVGVVAVVGTLMSRSVRTLEHHPVKAPPTPTPSPEPASL